MKIASGTTDQYIYFVAVDATDYVTRETALSSFTVYRSRDGAAAAAMTTPTINETDVTNMPGVYELLLDEDMTIGSGNDTEEMVFHITHAGMAPVSRTIELYRSKITIGNTLDVTATGAAGIDWGNVENPTTAVDLSSTDIQLVDTATTLTGHTAQTADHTAGIADIPTVAEFNARTLVAASYFDPAGDAVANVTLVDTTTTNTDMVSASPTANAIADQVWDEAKSGHVGAGSFGEEVQAHSLSSELSTHDGKLDTVDTNVDTINTNVSALNDISVADILTTQMTEAYAADGTAPTLAQALFLIQQSIGDFSISGTTITAKQLDGSTTAATYTLDDATDPTSRTRAS